MNGTQRDDVFVSLDKAVQAHPYRVAATAAIASIPLSVDLRQKPADGASFFDVKTKQNKKTTNERAARGEMFFFLLDFYFGGAIFSFFLKIAFLGPY